MEMSGPISRAVFPRCRRPRKRTAKAEFISASTGPLIRRRESALDGVWLITCSITPSRRLDQDRANLKSKIANRKCDGGEGGIRTLGSLLSYGALAKRCFQPLSHLTKNKARISLRISAFQSAIFNGRHRLRRVLAIFIGVANCRLPTD